MNEPIGVLLFSFGLTYFLFITFFVWFKPKRYMEYLHKRRERLKSMFPFLPNWLIGFSVFYENPMISTWWARIVIIGADIICILGLFATIHGPL